MVKQSLRWGITLACLALASTGLTSGPLAPANADTVITTQDYLDMVGITELHAQGLDGTGVKIALIDGPIDTSVPELQGVTIETRVFCEYEASPESIAHATALASILASPYWGWAPKATILSYHKRTQADSPPEPGTCTGYDTAEDFLVHQALNDGADVIVIASDSIEGIYPPIRAADMGVPMVVGQGNNGSSLASKTSASHNFTVGVGAVDATGQKTEYSNYGDGLSLMAFGGPITARVPDANGDLTILDPTYKGTSLAAPMVAGALALAMQKWPEANGNQLIRVLTDTADGTANHQVDHWTYEMAAGILNAPLLVATDPSGYLTTNPEYPKYYRFGPPAIPNEKDIQDYRDGLVRPAYMHGDPGYVYRGCNPRDIENQPWEAPDVKMEPGTAAICQTTTTAPTTPTQTTPADTTTPADPVTTPTSPPTDPSGRTSDSWIHLAIGVIGVLLITTIIIAIIRTRQPRTINQPPYPR